MIMAVKKKREAGFALLVVIVIMMLASFLSLQLIMETRTELKVAHNVKRRVRGRFLAEAGVSLAMFRIMENKGVLPITGPDGGEMERFQEGRIYEKIFSYGKIEYYAVDEGGKMNINGSGIAGQLRLFLKYKGLKEDEIDVVIDSLLDWRDTNDLHRLNGAEKDYYEGLAEPYTPRNGPLEDPSEFFLLKGTEALRGKFDPADVFTVYKRSNQQKINFRNLTPAMLDFFTEGSSEKKTAYYEMLADHPNLNINDLKDAIGAERYVVLQPFITTTPLNKFYIVAEGVVGVGGRIAAEDSQVLSAAEQGKAKKVKSGTVIKVLVQKEGTGFKYLSWTEKLI